MTKAKNAARDVLALMAPDAPAPETGTAADQAKALVDAHLESLIQELADALATARAAGMRTDKAGVAIVKVHGDRWNGFAHRLEGLSTDIVGEDLRGRFKAKAVDVVGEDLAKVAWAKPKSPKELAEEKAKAAAKEKAEKDRKRGKGKNTSKPHSPRRPVEVRTVKAAV